MSAKKAVGLVIFGIIVLLVLVTLFTSGYTVKAGEAAVITRFGKIQRVEREGWNFKLPSPLEEKVVYEIREQKFQHKYNVSSEDIQSIETEIAVQYNIYDPANVYRSFKKDYIDRLINPRVSEIVQASTAKYTIEEVVEKRQELSNLIYNSLKEDLKEYGIQVTRVSIVNHDFSDAFEKAIEEKKVAEQTARKVEIENQQKIKTAETNLKLKQLEAQANEVVSNSLTPQVLKKLQLDKWDGKLPQVSGSNSIVNLDLTKE